MATTTGTDEARTANFIDVSDFASLEDFKELPIGFVKPRKNNSNIYMANMEEPLCFYMPASEIMELYQDDDKINNIKFILDMDDHAEYIQFFYNLDNIVINMAFSKSVEWFGKEFDKETLARYYKPPYNMTDLDEERDDGLFYLLIMVDKPELLDDISDYRPNSEGRLLVVLEGIRFFKKSFTPLLRLVRIDDIDDVEDDDTSSDESAGLDFYEELASRRNGSPPKTSPLAELPLDKAELSLAKAELSLAKAELSLPKASPSAELSLAKASPSAELSLAKADTLSKSSKINDAVIHDLADVASTVNKKEYEIMKTSDDSSRVSKISVRDLEAILNEKRKLVQETSVNAEKASRAADLLKLKALKLEEEVKSYEKTLERLSLRK